MRALGGEDLDTIPDMDCLSEAEKSRIWLIVHGKFCAIVPLKSLPDLNPESVETWSAEELAQFINDTRGLDEIFDPDFPYKADQIIAITAIKRQAEIHREENERLTVVVAVRE